MTSLLTGQALTRRERREIEEHHEAPSAPEPQLHAPQARPPQERESQAPPLIVPAAPFSTLVMEPEPGPAVPSRAAPPVAYPTPHSDAPPPTRSGAAPVPDQPSAPRDHARPPGPGHSAPAAAQPLSRRERRLLEQPSSGGHGLTPSSHVGLPTGAATSARISAPSRPPEVTHQPVLPAYAPPAAQSYPAAPARQAPPESHEPTVSRGSGETTGPSSLILIHTPSVDLTGPLGDNGDVIVTGQIRISPQIVERGTAPFHYVSKDEDDTENVYSAGEGETMVKPVPASHAVASKGNNAELMLIRNTRWGAGAIVTVLSISVFAIAAVTLLVLSLTTGVLL
jgi:hypothetical protein